MDDITPTRPPGETSEQAPEAAGTLTIPEPYLRTMVFEAPKDLIPGLLPVGYTIIMGPPKTGKTALLLPMAHQLCWGGMRGLYLVLDDSMRRMRDRTIQASPDREVQNLWFHFGWNPRDKVEAFSRLEAWLAVSQAKGMPFDFVIVDTYGRYVGRRPSGDVFGFDYSVGQQFKVLCERYGCSIIVTHHTRKGASADGDDWLDQMSGSAGMAAATDAIWYITRTRGSREGVLYVTGNDIEEICRPLTLGDDMVWRASRTTTVAQAAHTGAPRAVLDYLTDHATGTLKEICDETGEKYNTVRSALSRLQGEGLVDCAGAAWVLTEHLDNALPGPDSVAASIWSPAVCDAPEQAQGGGNPPGRAPQAEAAAVPSQASSYPSRGSSIHTLRLDYSEMATAAELDAEPDPKARHVLARRGAIAASMKLMKDAVKRDGVRYHPALFTQPIRDTSYEKMPVWEGRNKWTPEGGVPDGWHVLQLDKSAAYLAASNTRLPIGALERDDDPEAAYADKRAGYHLVDPGTMRLAYGGPFHTRTEPGPVWITTPTLKVLREVAGGGYRILDSYTAPATEALLRPWIDTLRAERVEAIEAGDLRRYEWVKYCYSLVIATMGESGSNFEIRRAEWMHIIRAQAYANLWRTAVRAMGAGKGMDNGLDALNRPYQVVKVGNTDEIWIGSPHAFPEMKDTEVWKFGGGLGQWKVKGRIITGQTAEQPVMA